MTVSTELSHEEYTGNGVTTDFDFRFRIFDAKHLIVSVADTSGTESILTNGTDYTLRGVGAYRGGKVILKMPLVQGWKIGIARDLPAVQETDLRNQGKFFAEVHEDALDYLTMLVQKSLGFFSLCLRKPSFIADHYDAKDDKISNLGKPVKDGDAVDLGTMKEHIGAKDKRSLRVADKDIPALPNAANRANKLLSFDNDGNPVVAVPESGSAADVMVELGKPSGVSMIGTQHRRNLATDLDAIDRRPDGYKNNIQDVLNNGNDVEINKGFTISKSVTPDKNQVISGAGGEISISTAFAAVYTDARKEGKNLDKTKIIGLSINGVVVPDGEAAYGVFYRDIEYPVVDGLYASNFTGALINLHCSNSYIHNIRATKTVYHPSLVAGGYGVLVAESDQTIIDGVFFDANEGDDGRHLLYLSTSDGSGATNGNTNTIATNMIAKYKDKDDRNFWGINVRRSDRAVVNNFIIDGANGGFAYNPEQGNISQHITSNGVINVLKYKDDVGVYGIGHLYHDTNKIIGTLDTTLNISVDLKSRSLTGKDCVAHSISGINCMFSNSIVKVPRASSPIIINKGASHILIDGILDYSEGGDTTLAPFIAFSDAEGSCSDITVRGIKTHRPMFSRLHAVVDLTVDFQRKARLAISSGTVTKIDGYEIIKSTEITSNGIIIKFNNHVTQNAVDSVLIMDHGPTRSIISEYITGKAIKVSTYNLKGDSINPAVSNIIMHVNIMS